MSLIEINISITLRLSNYKKLLHENCTLNFDYEK